MQGGQRHTEGLEQEGAPAQGREEAGRRAAIRGWASTNTEKADSGDSVDWDNELRTGLSNKLRAGRLHQGGLRKHTQLQIVTRYIDGYTH